MKPAPPGINRLNLMITNFQFTAIGYILTPFITPTNTPIQPAAAQNASGTVILNEEYTPALKDLSGFSHIVLLYVFDRAKSPQLEVKPFMDIQTHGLFATRAPARPNPIGFSVVELMKIDQNRLTVQGVDMLNNTPLLDIKPYVPAFVPGTPNRFGWLEQNIWKMKTTRDDGRFSD